MELINNIVKVYLGYLVFVGVGECICEGNDLYYEMIELNVIKFENFEELQVVLVYGQMNEFFGVCVCVVLIGLIFVEQFCDVLGIDVLFFVDNIFCFIQVGFEVLVFLGCIFLVVGYQLILVIDMGVMQECIMLIKNGLIMLIQVVYVFVDDFIDFVLVIIFVYLDVIIVLNCVIFEFGIYFVVDLFDLLLCILDLQIVGEEYYNVVC